jgi:hypothetical protein
MSPLGLWALALLSAGPGYVRAQVESGNPNSHCLWWQGGDLSVTQSTFFLPNMGASKSPLDAVRLSFGTWQAQSNTCGNFSFKETATTGSDQVGYDFRASDNTNLIVFRQKLCSDAVPAGDACLHTGDCANAYHCWPSEYGGSTIGLTTTTFSQKTGEIFDADVEFNAANFAFSTSDTSVLTDVQNTATHEFGHFLGLAHAPNPASTMYAQAPVGQISKRELDPDSKQFVCDAYPKGNPSQDCLGAQANPEVVKQGCAAAPGALWIGIGVLALAAGRGKRKRAAVRV